MARLFINQATEYAKTRPSYPQEIFHYIASKTPSHDLVWDVGTGSGQAARSLAGMYKNVIATDTSLKQLEFAPKLANIQYRQTPPVMSMAELQQTISSQSSVDLVTVAQALHWFDLPSFYQQAKWVLKKPHGVIAAWCYTIPQVNATVDSVFNRFYSIDSAPYWDAARQLVDQEYRSIDFPFEPAEGAEHTGPFKFVTERPMDLDSFFTYIRSWSAYQTAKANGVELLKDDLVQDLQRAWDEDGHHQKLVKFPVHLRIGRVGNL